MALIATGCAAPGSPLAPDGNPGSGGSASHAGVDLEAEAAFCVDEVNRFRASAGLPALVRSSRIDEFSTVAAQVDTEAREAHRHFRQTNGGNGTSRAQNVIPWWQFSSYGSIRRITREGLAMMWAEGPGGGHYETMRGNFTQIGCGLYVQNGVVTVTQDFR